MRTSTLAAVLSLAAGTAPAQAPGERPRPRLDALLGREDGAEIHRREVPADEPGERRERAAAVANSLGEQARLAGHAVEARRWLTLAAANGAGGRLESTLARTSRPDPQEPRP